MRLGDWQFDAGSELLSQGQQTARLDPVEISVLMHLVEQAPNLVTTEDLLKQSWPEVVVGDNVVHRVIARLRKAFGDNARKPAYIETLARRGYRFIAEVDGFNDDPTTRHPSTDATTIAVLPFTGIGDDPSAEYFGDGIAEDILNGLVKSTSVKVIARTSAFQFKNRYQDVREIGQLLGASHLLEGSVRMAGDRIRVTAQLITAADGSHVWSEQFDSELSDVFAVQDEITRAVLGALNLFFRPLSHSPTSSPAAYAAFVKGRRMVSERKGGEAEEAFRHALALDPNYSEAHAELAGSASGKVFLREHNVSAMLKAIGDHLTIALKLDPSHHLARSTLATVQFFVERDFQQGLDTHQSLMREQPNDYLVVVGYAAQLRALGKLDLMLNFSRQALALDPLNPFLHWRMTEDLIWAGNAVEAQNSAATCQRLGMPSAHLDVGIAMLLEDRSTAQDLVDNPDAHWDSEERRLLYAAELAYDAQDNTKLAKYINALKPFATGQRALVAGPAIMRTLPGSIALLEGDIEFAVKDFEYMLTESYGAIWFAPGFPVDKRILRGADMDKRRYPALYNNEVFQALITQFGIDAESLSQVDVKPEPTLEKRT